MHVGTIPKLFTFPLGPTAKSCTHISLSQYEGIHTNEATPIWLHSGLNVV